MPLPLRRALQALGSPLLVLLGCTLVCVWGGCSRSALVVDPLPPLPADSLGSAIPPADCRADLDELAALVDHATPRPYLRRPEAEVRAEFARLAASIDEPITRRAFAGVLREACAAYGIGHQYVVGPHEEFNRWIERGGRSPSFAIRVEGDALVVARSRLAGLPDGATLASVGDVSAEELLRRMRARTSAETDAHRDDQVARQFPTHLWEMEFEAPYALAARTPEGAQIDIVDPGVVPTPRASMFAPARERAAASPSGRVDFRLLWPEPDIALLEWNAMDPRREAEWLAFLTATFGELRERGAAGLVVDLRSNGGGSSSLAVPLLAHLTDKPLRFAGGKLWRRSAEYDRFLESCIVWWARPFPWRSAFSSEYASMRIGEERLVEAPAPAPLAPREPRFEGAVRFLIGPATFSSAAMLADAVATYDLAPLVGRPTGGVPSSHGEIGVRRLSRSGVAVSFSSALFIRASGDAEDIEPVRPTLVVAETDDALRAAIDELRRRLNP